MTKNSPQYTRETKYLSIKFMSRHQQNTVLCVYSHSAESKKARMKEISRRLFQHKDWQKESMFTLLSTHSSSLNLNKVSKKKVCFIANQHRAGSPWPMFAQPREVGGGHEVGLLSRDCGMLSFSKTRV